MGASTKLESHDYSEPKLTLPTTFRLPFLPAQASMSSGNPNSGDDSDSAPDSDALSLRLRRTSLGDTSQPIDLAAPLDRGRYNNPVEIGRGGMGVVWKLWDTKLDRPVAVKRLLANQDIYPEIAVRFLAEAKVLAKLNHPNIVAIYDQGQDKLGSYIVMEYVEGTNLLELIKQQGTLPIADSIRVIRKVCEGLWEAHQAGIIHRDIKPSNILVDRKGRVKLTDFGLARAAGGLGQSMTGQVLGTEGYMAPEQYADPRRATAQSDQYSLAATLYHMATGLSPRKLDFRRIPAALLDFLSKALDDEPAARFPDLASFTAELALITSLQKSSSPVSSSEQQAASPVSPPPLPSAEADLPRLAAPEKANSPINPAASENAGSASAPPISSTGPTSTAVTSPLSADSKASEGDSNLARLYLELRRQSDANLSRARQHYEAYEDAAALELLRGIPDDLRDHALERLAQQRLDRGRDLETKIAQRVRSMKTSGLRALVDQYLKHYPKNADMLALREQLTVKSTMPAKSTTELVTALGAESNNAIPQPEIPGSVNSRPLTEPRATILFFAGNLWLLLVSILYLLASPWFCFVIYGFITNGLGGYNNKVILLLLFPFFGGIAAQFRQLKSARWCTLFCAFATFCGQFLLPIWDHRFVRDEPFLHALIAGSIAHICYFSRYYKNDSANKFGPKLIATFGNWVIFATLSVVLTYMLINRDDPEYLLPSSWKVSFLLINGAISWLLLTGPSSLRHLLSRFSYGHEASKEFPNHAQAMVLLVNYAIFELAGVFRRGSEVELATVFIFVMVPLAVEAIIWWRKRKRQSDLGENGRNLAR
jgi:serine/threonine protein kinase